MITASNIKLELEAVIDVGATPGILEPANTVASHETPCSSPDTRQEVAWSRNDEEAEDPAQTAIEPPENQSMHSPFCDPEVCHRIKWNKASYLGCGGLQSVKITDHNGIPDELEYIPASHRTMAISHVWAQEQGGHPHFGINSCLYQWYRSIAKKQWDAQRGVARCDSFWIDAACIPEEHGLRKKAIANINVVFQNAGVVLAIDKDIMRCVASSSEEDMVLVHEAWQSSDWNKRAWTLLEGIRGSNQLRQRPRHFGERPDPSNEAAEGQTVGSRGVGTSQPL
jgi:hypothetical protein